jgi:putative PIN family toxin of toxin-antitoxin system
VRVILDTNILISALLVSGGTTEAIVQAWRNRAFTLLTCDEQIDELHDCFARPWLVPECIRRHEAGRLINTLRRFAVFVGPLPAVERSPDSDGDFLLALAEAGQADTLVTGDKAGLLALRTHQGPRIMTARDFVPLIPRR